MLSVIAHVKIDPEKQATFTSMFRELRQEIVAKEPNTLMYELFRSRSEENMFYIIEKYRDDNAFNFHCEAGHTQDFLLKAKEQNFPLPDMVMLDAL
jgi:quinol monooxygenase YgiN